MSYRLVPTEFFIIGWWLQRFVIQKFSFISCALYVILFVMTHDYLNKI